MQKVLIVNDDGYKAAGIRALIREFSEDYEVTAVAPDRQQSWMGKSISGHHQLHLTPITYHEFKGYHVNGTPADCTQLGLHETGRRPDFVLSGINHGANTGNAYTLSSGTVGAALEAALQGVPAFSISLFRVQTTHAGMDLDAPESIDIFAGAAKIAKNIVEKIMEIGFPLDTQVISINVPSIAQPHAPWVVTKPHSLPYGKLFSVQPNGDYRNTDSAVYNAEEEPSSDLGVLSRGYVSLVPISLQLTSGQGRADLASKLNIELID